VAMSRARAYAISRSGCGGAVLKPMRLSRAKDTETVSWPEK
jgi:hypothetical protein